MPCLYSCFGAVVKDEHVTVTGTSCLEKCDNLPISLHASILDQML